MAKAAARNLYQNILEGEDYAEFAKQIMKFILDLLGLDGDLEVADLLTEEYLSLIAEEIRSNESYLLQKITTFVRKLFSLSESDDDHIFRLLKTLNEFRPYLEKLRLNSEGSLVTGLFSLLIFEQVLPLNSKSDLDEDLKKILTRTLKFSIALTFGAKPCLEFSVAFIKLFCDVLDSNYAIALMACDSKLLEKFLRKWLLVDKKSIEHTLFKSILRYLLKENEPESEKTMLARILTSKSFLHYFHNSLKDELSFQVILASLELTDVVHMFTEEEYLCWIAEAITEKNPVYKERYVLLYVTYREKAGHPQAHILKDVIKSFIYEDTCQEMSAENFEIICKHLPFAQNPLFVVENCTLDDSFNEEFGHICIDFLKAAIISSLSNNRDISEFFKAIPTLLNRFKDRRFEKGQIVDIFLSLENVWKSDRETMISVFKTLSKSLSDENTQAIDYKQFMTALSKIDKNKFENIVAGVLRSYIDSINSNPMGENFADAIMKITGLVDLLDFKYYFKILTSVYNILNDNFPYYSKDCTEANTIFIFSRLLYKCLHIIFDESYDIKMKRPICQNYNKWIERFHKYLENKLKIYNEDHIKQSSFFANKAIKALQTIYITYEIHPAVKTVLKYNGVLSPERLQFMITCMVHYLKVADDNVLEQRGILRDFTRFCDLMPKMPSNHIFLLFEFYPQNIYRLELEELMTVLYKNKMLVNIIPVVIFRIPDKFGSETLNIYQQFKTILKKIIENHDELMLFHAHIVLSVLDMIQKKAVVYSCEEGCNRLELLKSLKTFRSFSKLENLENVQNTLLNSTTWTLAEKQSITFFFQST